MGFFDFLFRRGDDDETEDPSEPVMGGGSRGPLTVEHDYRPGEGGKHVLYAELSQLRWSTTAEMTNLARSNPDPANWRDGLMQFEMERSAAHDYEARRDQLSNYVANRLADDAGAVYEAAFEVGEAREELRRVDEDLAQVTRDWRRKYRLAEMDPMEIGRFYRLQSEAHRFWKILIIVILIVVEWVLTANVFAKLFEGRFDTPPEVIGGLLSVGIIILLIVVPHYAAIGIKEGISSFHTFARADYVRRGAVIPVELLQMEHREKKEDRVFVWVSALMGAFLMAAIIPLSWLRAADLETDLAPTWVWFMLFAAVQVAISMFFFFREWLDYGLFSQDLHKVHKDLEELEDHRSDAIAWVSSAGASFHIAAEDLLFTLQEAPRWDSYIVEAYLGTIHFCRHLVGLENPDIRPFIAGAIVPYLGTRSEAEESEYPLQALSLEHASLEDDRPFGRKWRIRRVGEEWVADFEGDEDADDDEGDIAWMLTKTPWAILEEILDRYFDLPAEYERPAVFDTVDDEEEVTLPVYRGSDDGPDVVEDEADSGDPPDVGEADDVELESGVSPAEPPPDDPPSIVPVESSEVDRTTSTL